MGNEKQKANRIESGGCCCAEGGDHPCCKLSIDGREHVCRCKMAASTSNAQLLTTTQWGTDDRIA